MKLSLEACISQDFIVAFGSGKENRYKCELMRKPEKQKQYKYWTLDDDERLSKLAKEKELAEIDCEKLSNEL